MFKYFIAAIILLEFINLNLLAIGLYKPMHMEGYVIINVLAIAFCILFILFEYMENY